MEAVRTLPIRMAPLPGESLDSWLEALARRLHTRYGSLLSHLGLVNQPKDSGRSNAVNWTVALSDEEASGIAHATGVNREVIHALTLARFGGRAVLIDHEKRKVNRHRLWGRGAGSRYCPDCLAESCGRWQLNWRLGWSFACVRHRLLLADACPACGRLPRRYPFSRHSVPLPGVCGFRPSRELHPVAPGCGQDLARAENLRLPKEHPALKAQSLLSQTIEAGTADFGQYAHLPQACAVALSEVRAVAGRMLTSMDAAGLATLVPGDVLDAHLHPEPGARPKRQEPERAGFMAPPTAAMTAVGVIAALRVLGEEDLATAARTLRPLTSTVRDGFEKCTATTVGTWGRGTGPVLRKVQLAALAASMRPSDQLRYRTSADPAPPSAARQRQRLRRRASRLPAAMWPQWAVRLSPSRGAYPRVLAPALAAATLLVGSRISFDEAVAMLGQTTDALALSRMLQMLEQTPRWETTASALTRLADHLDARPSPINYERRRSLDYTDLLFAETWAQICRDAGQHPGTGRRLRIARCIVFTQISGTPIEHAPEFPTADHNVFRAEAERFTEVWTPRIREALREAARAFLHRHGIRREPLTWHPPTNLLDDLDLPGRDADGIDIQRLHDLVRGRRSPTRAAAATLGLSIEAVRLALEEHPAPAQPLTPSQARALGRVSHAIRRILTEEELRRRYLDERQSAKAIADDLGVSRQTITRLALEYGIPLQQGRRGHHPVDREWLFEQYVICRRPLPELAREMRVSTATMNRWAHDLDIPLRPRGGASHREALRPDTGSPS
ncbi:TniQ protein [Streptomyces sp. DvalAA-14]|uniref:TniQ family protein n=1 Tax=unclassified Streptomyces TaxID=2593676 RepID=UPI00081B4A41|nr:TniQ family protein [Streptomyces sp. DvalAA-14]MYS21569.1 LysR family transcriptional regulator [Streptomyces sp. SID4948]SCD95875.1 TniQ protein [Streptomyces sp. DvalAA-14]